MDEIMKDYYINQYYEICNKLETLITYYIYLKDEDNKLVLIHKMNILNDARIRLYNKIKDNKLYNYNWFYTLNEDLKEYTR